MKRVLVLSLLAMLVSACSIKQVVEPAQVQQHAKVCVVNNPQVKEGFLVALKNSLEEKGIDYRVVDNSFDDSSCDWKVTYTANWTWDMALYMSYAKISVYHNGLLNGYAEYDSRSGSGRLDKFINAEAKVRELVEELMQVKQAFLGLHTFS